MFLTGDSSSGSPYVPLEIPGGKGQGIWHGWSWLNEAHLYVSPTQTQVRSPPKSCIDPRFLLPGSSPEVESCPIDRLLSQNEDSQMDFGLHWMNQCQNTNTASVSQGSPTLVLETWFFDRCISSGIGTHLAVHHGQAVVAFQDRVPDSVTTSYSHGFFTPFYQGVLKNMLLLANSLSCISDLFSLFSLSLCVICQLYQRGFYIFFQVTDKNAK